MSSWASVDTPAQPAAPDYAAANREGIVTDISTLALRNKIDAARRLGQPVTYTDPATGQEVTADFSKMGDAEYAKQMADLAGATNATVQRDQLALRKELGVANAEQTAAEIAAADPAGYNLRNKLTNRAADELDLGAVNITPSGQIIGAEERLRQRAEQAPTYDPSGMNRLQDEAARRDGRLGSLIDRTRTNIGSEVELNNLRGEAARLPGEAKDATTNALNQGLQQALAEYQLGGTLDEASKREALNNARAGQVARGNYLGDAAAVVEATELGKAGNELKQQRLQNLLDIQNRAFGQNTQLRGETTANAKDRLAALTGLQATGYGQDQGKTAMLGDMIGRDVDQNQNRIRQEADLAGQNFNQGQSAYQTGLNAAQAAMGAATTRANEERTSRTEGFGYDQTRVANANNIALGSPITNEFNKLGGAANGTVGYTPVNFTGGTNTNPNAGASGANFANSTYGTAANMWNTSANIAANGNPWMSLAGKALGTAAGNAAASI